MYNYKEHPQKSSITIDHLMDQILPLKANPNSKKYIKTIKK